MKNQLYNKNSDFSCLIGRQALNSRGKLFWILDNFDLSRDKLGAQQGFWYPSKIEMFLNEIESTIEYIHYTNYTSSWL